MSPVGGAKSDPLPSAASRSTKEAPGRLTGRLGAIFALLAGLLGTISCLTPWWYLATPTSRVEYFPGSAVYVTGGGGGGTTTYAASGVAAVGTLYELVAAGAVVVAVIGWAVGGLGAVWLTGRGRSSRAIRVRRAVLAGGLAVGLVLLVGVPLAQPALYAAANPAGACSSRAPPGACTSFWGSATIAGGTTEWAAGSGWWLCAVSTAMLALALGLRPDGPRPPPGRAL